MLSKTCTVVTLFILILHYCSGQTFQNPIFENLTAHGFYGSILKHGGYYYLPVIPLDQSGIQLLESIKLSNFRNAQAKMIYQASPEIGGGVIDPNMYEIEGQLYIYFKSASLQRIFVIKCLDPSKPLGEWSQEVRLLPEWDQNSYQPALLQYPTQNNGQETLDLYLIWVVWEPGVAGHLYISKMDDPMTANSTVRLLRSPHPERGETNFNDGPSVIRRNRRAFLVFSTYSQEAEDTCLRIMGIDCGLDPMVHSNWWDDVTHCVFQGNETAQVSDVRRASFAVSPDDSELWMVYPAAFNKTSGNSRDLFIQRLEWEMDAPKFPLVAPRDAVLDAPSGE